MTIDRTAFETLLARLGEAWTRGDAGAAAACFAEDVDYADPTRYRFASREALLSFFEPPSGGHAVTWHRVLFDAAAQGGVVEYTYVGHRRYHGAAIVELGWDGTIVRWREWQHVSDELDWDAFLAGPAEA